MRLWGSICGAAIIALLSAGAHAQEDPEAVYAKLHAATLTGNSDAVIAFATAKQKADLASKSKAEKDGVIMFMSKLMPRTYKITEKNIAADGNSAILRGTGMGEFMGSKSEMYLNANFVKEGGAWKVDQWGWTSDKPAGGAAKAAAAPKPAAPKPAPMVKQASAAAPRPAAAKPAPAASPTLTSAPAGQAKPDCVYKPVMTNEDMRNCGIGVR